MKTSLKDFDYPGKSVSMIILLVCLLVPMAVSIANWSVSGALIWSLLGVSALVVGYAVVMAIRFGKAKEYAYPLTLMGLVVGFETAICLWLHYF